LEESIKFHRPREITLEGGLEITVATLWGLMVVTMGMKKSKLGWTELVKEMPGWTETTLQSLGLGAF
jgi:hypothetical protein